MSEVFRVGGMDCLCYDESLFRQKISEVERLVTGEPDGESRIKLISIMIDSKMVNSCWKYIYAKRNHSHSEDAYGEYGYYYTELLYKNDSRIIKRYDPELSRDGFIYFFLFNVSRYVKGALHIDDSLEKIDGEYVLHYEVWRDSGFDIEAEEEGLARVENNGFNSVEQWEIRAYRVLGLVLSLIQKMRQDEEKQLVGKNENKRRRYKIAFLTRDFVHAIRNEVDVVNLHRNVMQRLRECYTIMDHNLLRFTYRLFPGNHGEVSKNPLKTNGDLFPGEGEGAYQNAELRTPFIGRVLASYLSISIGRISQIEDDYESFKAELLGKASNAMQ